MWLEAPPSTPGISPRARLDHRLARYPITTITSALDSDLVTVLILDVFHYWENLVLSGSTAVNRDFREKSVLWPENFEKKLRKNTYRDYLTIESSIKLIVYHI